MSCFHEGVQQRRMFGQILDFQNRVHGAHLFVPRVTQPDSFLFVDRPHRILALVEDRFANVRTRRWGQWRKRRAGHWSRISRTHPIFWLFFSGRDTHRLQAGFGNPEVERHARRTMELRVFLRSSGLASRQGGILLGRHRAIVLSHCQRAASGGHHVRVDVIPEVV